MGLSSGTQWAKTFGKNSIVHGDSNSSPKQQGELKYNMKEVLTLSASH